METHETNSYCKKNENLAAEAPTHAFMNVHVYICMNVDMQISM